MNTTQTNTAGAVKPQGEPKYGRTFGSIIRSNGDGTITFRDPNGRYCDNTVDVGHAGISYQRAKNLADMIADAPNIAAQRDELLAVLKYIEGRLPSGDTKSISQARAAIARTEGRSS